MSIAKLSVFLICMHEFAGDLLPRQINDARQAQPARGRHVVFTHPARVRSGSWTQLKMDIETTRATLTDFAIRSMRSATFTVSPSTVNSCYCSSFSVLIPDFATNWRTCRGLVSRIG